MFDALQLSVRPSVLLAVIALVPLAGACAADGASAAPSPSNRIVIFGDSLAVSPGPAGAFPAVLQRRLDDAGMSWSIVNLSRSGETTARGLARFDEALAKRPEILVLELGGNDGLQGVPVDTVRRNLGEMIERAKQRGIRVLLCGMETLPHHGFQYLMSFHYIYPDLAREYNVPLVPFLLAGVAGDRTLNNPDLIHPNAAGAQRIADNVWPHLVETLSPAIVAVPGGPGVAIPGGPGL